MNRKSWQFNSFKIFYKRAWQTFFIRKKKCKFFVTVPKTGLIAITNWRLTTNILMKLASSWNPSLSAIWAGSRPSLFSMWKAAREPGVSRTEQQRSVSPYWAAKWRRVGIPYSLRFTVNHHHHHQFNTGVIKSIKLD